MRVEPFYQTNTEHAISLVMLGASRFINNSGELSSHDYNSLKAQQFSGKLGEIGAITNNKGLTQKIYIGAGENATDEQVMAAAVMALPVGSYQTEKKISLAAQVVWSLAQYQFDKYRATTNMPRILVVAKRNLKEIITEASAIFLVRDLINTPANDMGPKALSDAVAGVAHEHGAEFTAWVGDDLLREKFFAIHAVGRGAEEAPRLLSLTWGNPKHPRVALIGKGVCFDSGGLDIKPAVNMRWMKKDMGGGAHVIGLAAWIMANKLPVHLTVLVPAVENAVDGKSFRPGDVIKMRNGLSVEIDNTDAEGRLVLADAFSYACENNPELIIDFATLTGAARVAVGTDIAALFSNNNEVAQELLKVSQKVNDPVWQLPIFDEYKELLASKIADYVNSSASPYAGATVAALFLQLFITPDIPWLHFDIMAWNLRSKPGRPEGGEAMGLRAVYHYLKMKYA